MSESRDEDRVQLSQSDYTAEELPTILRELIINSSDISELTTAVIEATLGIRLAPYGEDAERYVGRLTPDWNISLVVFADEVYGRASMSPSTAASESHPPMTDMCGVDSDAFAALLGALANGERCMASMESVGVSRHLRGQNEVTTFTMGGASEPTKRSLTRASDPWVRDRSVTRPEIQLQIDG